MSVLLESRNTDDIPCLLIAFKLFCKKPADQADVDGTPGLALSIVANGKLRACKGSNARVATAAEPDSVSMCQMCRKRASTDSDGMCIIRIAGRDMANSYLIAGKGIAGYGSKQHEEDDSE
ncbi:MAG: hypothetical protein P8166_07005 [Candidatus Thiodiazotropha sp.]